MLPPLSPHVVWKLPGPGRTSPRHDFDASATPSPPAVLRRGSGAVLPELCSIPPSPIGGHGSLRPDDFGGGTETSVSLHREPRPSSMLSVLPLRRLAIEIFREMKRSCSRCTRIGTLQHDRTKPRGRSARLILRRVERNRAAAAQRVLQQLAGRIGRGR